ncbi:MAG: hypothetical protein ACJA09_000997 [Alcanivorax sp.]|jgi:hypothetical protein
MISSDQKPRPRFITTPAGPPTAGSLRCRGKRKQLMQTQLNALLDGLARAIPPIKILDFNVGHHLQ